MSASRDQTGDPAGDTVVAIATPPGRGALAIVRLSGPSSIVIADRCFRGSRSLATTKERRASYGRLVDGEERLIDDVVATAFHAPRSYTGEEAVEITCHGSPFIAARIVDRLMSEGARAAEPGEYTRRAFLNGRLDLAQAEAVAELIEAASATALRGARSRLDGELSRHVGSLRDRLLEVAGLTELALDFADEEVPLLQGPELARRINEVRSQVGYMLATFGIERMLHDGVQVALVGKPNVGKSSLLNRLAKEARALVSDVPGTTRDAIDVDVEVEGVHLRLIDTAGIHHSSDRVERLGMARTYQVMRDADLVAVVLQCSQDRCGEVGAESEAHAHSDGDAEADAVSDADAEADDHTGADACPDAAAELAAIPADRLFVVANKCDLGPAPKAAQLAVSALTGEGIPELARLLVERSVGAHAYSERSATLASARQRDSLQRAHATLAQAAALATPGDSGELVAAELHLAIRQLEEMIGEVSSGEILDQVFARFCIGK